MNQAFINGFVKRAMEYGYNKLDALLIYKNAAGPVDLTPAMVPESAIGLADPKAYSAVTNLGKNVFWKAPVEMMAEKGINFAKNTPETGVFTNSNNIFTLPTTNMDFNGAFALNLDKSRQNFSDILNTKGNKLYFSGHGGPGTKYLNDLVPMAHDPNIHVVNDKPFSSAVRDIKEFINPTNKYQNAYVDSCASGVCSPANIDGKVLLDALKYRVPTMHAVPQSTRGITHVPLPQYDWNQEQGKYLLNQGENSQAAAKDLIDRAMKRDRNITRPDPAAFDDASILTTNQQ